MTDFFAGGAADSFAENRTFDIFKLIHRMRATRKSWANMQLVAYAKAEGYIALAKNSADISMMNTAHTIRPYLKVAPL